MGVDIYIQSFLILFIPLFLLLSRYREIKFERVELAFITLILVSSIISEAAVYSLLQAYSFILVYTFTRSNIIKEIHLRTVLKFVTLFIHTSIIIGAFLGILSFDQRLGGIVSPNTTAVFIYSSLPGIFYFRSRFLQALLLIFGMSCIYIVSSRSVLVASFILIVSYAWMNSAYSRLLKLSFLLLALVLCGYLIVTLDILSLQDKYRGLNSGFTGRTIAWKYALETWRQHPLLGIGFNNSALVFSSFTGVIKGLDYEFGLTGTHNGYLSILLELGIINTLVFLMIIAKRIKQIMAQSINRDHMRIAYISGFLFINIFEDLMTSYANICSLIFFLYLNIYSNESNHYSA